MSDDRTASRRRATLLVSRAWKRIMLDEQGKLHSDARLILRDLFDKAGFYAAQQYFPGQNDLTVARASRREIVIHILALIEKSEDEIVGNRKASAIPEHQDGDVENTVETMRTFYE